MNMPTLPHSYNEPDEHRLPADMDKIPYDWLLTPLKMPRVIKRFIAFIFSQKDNSLIKYLK